jgi:hypothetical protein
LGCDVAVPKPPKAGAALTAGVAVAPNPPKAGLGCC